MLKFHKIHSFAGRLTDSGCLTDPIRPAGPILRNQIEKHLRNNEDACLFRISVSDSDTDRLS